MRGWWWCVFLLTAAQMLGQNWYRSNSSGMSIRQLRGPVQQGWVLEANGGNRTLYRDGKEVESWLTRSVDGQRVVEHRVEQERREIRTYRRDGLLVKVEYFRNGNLEGVEQYLYQGKWLTRVDYRDGNEQLVWEKTYQRRANGSMVSQHQRFISSPEGDNSSAIINAGLARLTKKKENKRFEVFDEQGRVLQKEEFQGETLVRQIVYRRRNGEIFSERTTYPERDEVQVRLYNDNQQVTSRTLHVAGQLLEAVSYRYDENQRLQEEERVGRSVMTLRYSYLPGGDQLASIDYYQRGLLTRTRFDFQPEPASYSERFYVDGQPLILRVYRNNALVKEELLQQEETLPRFQPSPQQGL